MNMTKNILVLGRMRAILDDVLQQLERADIQLFGSTSIEDIQSVFAQANIDHVFVGAGFDLETRLEIVREILQLSDTTTVHMLRAPQVQGQDRASRVQGILLFVRSVLRGLLDDEESSA
jgi:hypothetical protein